MAAHHTRLTKGFTLIELLVVVSIITVMSGVLIPSFSSYIKRQNVKQAQQQLVADIRAVQVKALAGALSDELISGNPVEFWGMRFSNGGSTYDSFISDEATSAACTSALGSPYHQDMYRMAETDIGTYDTPNPSPCIFFSMANGDISIPGSANFGEYSLEVRYATSGSSDKHVLFNEFGLIYASD